jgi:hypothetical protein
MRIESHRKIRQSAKKDGEIPRSVLDCETCITEGIINILDLITLIIVSGSHLVTLANSEFPGNILIKNIMKHFTANNQEQSFLF